MSMVTYYIPKRLKEDVILLADKLNIKITKIKEEDTDIRIFCVGFEKLLEMFNQERILLLGPERI